LRSACRETMLAHARADAQDRIEAGKGSGAHADRELRRKGKPVGDGLVKAALPITAVPPARECDGIEHQCHALEFVGDCRVARATCSARSLPKPNSGVPGFGQLHGWSKSEIRLALGGGLGRAVFVRLIASFGTCPALCVWVRRT